MTTPPALRGRTWSFLSRTSVWYIVVGLGFIVTGLAVDGLQWNLYFAPLWFVGAVVHYIRHERPQRQSS